MPEIKIKIRDKRAGGTGTVICGNSDYTVAWDLDQEWTPYDTKTMRVNLADGTYQDVVFAGDTAALPALSTPGWASVGLYAGDLHTSRAADLRVLPSVTTPSGAPANPTPDVYDQLMELIKGLGGAQGEKGDTGPAGPQGPAGATGPQGPAGHSPVVTATKSGKVTTIEVDGTAIAAVNDGADAEDTRVIAVAIPAVVRVLTGSEFNIYYANVISQQNAMLWCSAANGLTIKRYGDHLSITANAPGTYPLQWRV